LVNLGASWENIFSFALRVKYFSVRENIIKLTISCQAISEEINKDCIKIPNPVFWVTDSESLANSLMTSISSTISFRTKQ